jgi:pimeloyl-ACP methyl ester carboxylesterase
MSMAQKSSTARPDRPAEAFKRDIPNATVRFFDTGHFALETHAAEIAGAIRDWKGSGW